MNKLVTKLRKGPVPTVQEKKPDSPESMGSLFAEAGEGYFPDSESDAEDTETVKPQPAVTPFPLGGYLRPAVSKKPKLK